MPAKLNEPLPARGSNDTTATAGDTNTMTTTEPTDTATGVGLFVAGDLPTQGSKNVYPGKNGGRPVVVESMHHRIQDYRGRIYVAWRRLGFEKIPGAVDANLVYYLPRPKAHFSTAKAKRGQLAPRFVDAIPSVKPDIDKLNRATFDALTLAGAIEDDARIVRESAVKVYADTADDVGVKIYLRPFIK